MIKELQYLRAVAIIMVIWGHMPFFFQGSGISPYFEHMAQAGVDIFFVLSGYVVGKSLIESLDLGQPTIQQSIESNIPHLKKFFKRRFYRLVPVALLLIFLNIVIKHNGFITEITGFFSYLTLQNDFDALYKVPRSISHFWSLAVEERFYLFAPLLILIFRQHFIKVAIGIILIWPLIKNLGFTESEIYTNGFLRLDSFMFGILIFLLQKNTNIWKIFFDKKLNPVVTNLVSLLIIIILARLPILQVGDGWGHYQDGHKVTFTGSPYYYFVVYALSSILILFAIQDKDYFLEIPGLNKILTWFGDRSYCLYVLHFFYLFLSIRMVHHFDLEESKTNLGLFYIFWMIFLTEIIYRFYETPLRKLGRK